MECSGIEYAKSLNSKEQFNKGKSRDKTAKNVHNLYYIHIINITIQ